MKNRDAVTINAAVPINKSLRRWDNRYILLKENMNNNYIIRQATIEDEENMLKLSKFVADNFTRNYLGDEIVDWYIDSGNCDEDMRKGINNSA